MRKKIMDSFDYYVNFWGEVPKSVLSKMLLCGVPVVYLILGVYMLNVARERVVIWDKITNYTVGVVIFICGIGLSVFSISMFLKSIYLKLERNISIKNMLFFILFLSFMAYRAVYHMFQRGLNISKQKKIFKYIGEMYIVAVTIGIMFVVIFEFIIFWSDNLLEGAYNRFVAFCYIMIALFVLSKVIDMVLHMAISYEVRDKYKRAFEQMNGKISFIENRKRNRVFIKQSKDKRKEKVKKRMQEIEVELEFTKLYSYIFLNILILCLNETENTNIQLLKDEFIGITAIAALFREIKGRLLVVGAGGQQ